MRGRRQGRQKTEVGKTILGNGQNGVRKVPEGSGEYGEMEETGCEIICGAPTTLEVKGLMMMMMKVVLFELYMFIPVSVTLPLNVAVVRSS